MIFHKIDWAPNEVFLKLGPLAIHWYSLMFIVAFTLGYYITKRIYQNEKNEEIDNLREQLPQMSIVTIIEN